MRDGFIAPNINLDELDPELTGLDVVTAMRPSRPRLVLSDSFGFGGTNAVLVMQAHEAS
jgi:3-oxoacyl-[acyl-carrier-protein] synthase-1